MICLNYMMIIDVYIMITVLYDLLNSKFFKRDLLNECLDCGLHFFICSWLFV